MSQIFTTKEITINGVSTPVRRDEAGRINLNELHRASGGAEKKAPAKFLRNKAAKALIDSLTLNGQISPIKSDAGVPATVDFLFSRIGELNVGNHTIGILAFFLLLLPYTSIIKPSFNY